MILVPLLSITWRERLTLALTTPLLPIITWVYRMRGEEEELMEMVEES